MFDKISHYTLPLHYAFFKKLRKIKNRYSPLPYKQLLDYDELSRPNYGFCIYEAAMLAKALDYPKISIIEFGLAGGNGLVNIEYHIKKIKKELKIDFEVYGFDMESGLPKTDDYRDMKYSYRPGSHKMDRKKLESKIEFSKLIIGDVKETCKNFFNEFNPAPIGCILVDLDYYSSTLDAFQIFETNSKNYLPRVSCYFDEIMLTNDYVGELCAINEFNQKHENKKIAKIYGLSLKRKIPRPWNDNIFNFHDFTHPKYNSRINLNKPGQDTSLED